MNFIYNKAFNMSYYDETLDNGLKIRFIRKKGFLNKSVFLTINFGSNYKDFTYNNEIYHLKSGIAHAIEHKIYENADGSDAFLELSRLGVNANAFTTTNFTCYHFDTPNDIIDGLIKTFDFVLNPYFNQQSINKEIPIILEEKKRKEEDPYLWFDTKMVELLFPGSARTDSVLGSYDDIKSFTDKDLYLGYNAFYKLSNMHLIIVGDIDFEETLQTVKNYTKKYKPDFNIGKITLPLNETIEDKAIIENSDVEIPKASIGFKLIKPTKKAFYIYQALFYYMYSSSGENRLKMLNEGLINTSLDVTIFNEEDMLYATLSVEDEDCDNMISNILHNLKEFDITKIGEEDLILFKRYYLGGIYSLGDSIGGFAEANAYKFVFGDDILDAPRLINSITLEEVYNAFSYYKDAKKARILMKR